MHPIQPLRPALTALILAAWTGSAQSAPFTNGSLESTSSALIEIIPNGNSAYSWNVSGASIDFVRQGYSFAGDTLAAPHDGLWMVDLNGSEGPGTISQTFDTVAGQSYLVSFWMSGNAGPGGVTAGDTKSLSVSWNSATVTTATYAHQPGDNWSNLRWENHSVVVVATGTSSTLAFTSTSNTYLVAGPLLDDITVTPIPEPATGAAVLAALALLLPSARRRLRGCRFAGCGEVRHDRR